MTTTETPVLPADAPVPNCEKCGVPMTRVEGTNVVNCNRCGTTASLDAEAQDDAPRETSDEAVRPDEVIDAGEARPSTEEAKPEEERVDQNEALERAVESALSSPGVPGRDEFLTLAQTARMLSMSPLVPKFLRNNPSACFHLAMIGRDLGISPTSAVELIDVMPEDRNDPSKGGRPMLSPELLNAQVARVGLGSIVPLVRTEARCVAVALAPGGALDRRCVANADHLLRDDDGKLLAPELACQCHGILGETEFTWEDARVANLVQRAGHDYGADHEACEPGNHKPYRHQTTGNSWTRCDCNQGYITYPKRMLWWRASGFCQSDFMPQASLGLYSPEALGAVVDENGRMIDPSQVALPEGYGPPPPAEVDMASAAEVEAIATRIALLPPKQQTKLKNEWKERKIEPVTQLTAAGHRSAHTMITKYEAEAQREGTWTPPDEAPQPRAPAPAAAQEGDEGPAEGGEGTEEPPAPSDAPAAPEGMPPDLAAQYGRPKPVATAALSEGAAKTVKVMTPRALNDALRSRTLSVEGSQDDRGLRLARVLAAEAAQEDWDRAQKWGQS